jgi:hypothetical protein
MASRKPLKPVSQSFLDGAPVETKAVEPPKPRAKKAAAPQPDLFAQRIALPEPEAHPVKAVSLKIPYQLYSDIDEIRKATGLTATDIFIKSAAPEVAMLLQQLRERQAVK